MRFTNVTMAYSVDRSVGRGLDDARVGSAIVGERR